MQVGIVQAKGESMQGEVQVGAVPGKEKEEKSQQGEDPGDAHEQEGLSGPGGGVERQGQAGCPQFGREVGGVSVQVLHPQEEGGRVAGGQGEGDGVYPGVLVEDFLTGRHQHAGALVFDGSLAGYLPDIHVVVGCKIFEEMASAGVLRIFEDQGPVRERIGGRQGDLQPESHGILGRDDGGVRGPEAGGDIWPEDLVERHPSGAVHPEQEGGIQRHDRVEAVEGHHRRRLSLSGAGEQEQEDEEAVDPDFHAGWALDGGVKIGNPAAAWGGGKRLAEMPGRESTRGGGCRWRRRMGEQGAGD